MSFGALLRTSFVFRFFPCFEFLRSPNLTSFMSAFLVRKKHHCPWSLPCIDVRGGLDAERWHDLQNKWKGKTISELSWSGSAYLWKAWLSSDLTKCRPLLGEERERIPGLASWRGQRQHWRGGQGPGRQCLGAAPREGRQGWLTGHQQGNSLAHPALVTPQPSAGHQHWDRDYPYCSRIRCGADQLKCSECSQKQTLRQERTGKKPRHPNAGIKDNGEQGPTLHAASVNPTSVWWLLFPAWHRFSCPAWEHLLFWERYVGNITTKSWNNQGLEREIAREDQRHF